MKTRVNVEIPKSQIDDLTKKKIQSLERENKRLQDKISKLEREQNENKFTIERSNKIIEAVREAGEFCHDGCYGDH